MPDNLLFKSLQDRPWALERAKFEEISAFIERRLTGEKLEFPAATAGKSGNRAGDGYQVLGGVAVLPVYGVIDKRMNVLMNISGGTSTELLARDFQKALDDPQVQAILLDVDSPGGSVDGPKDVADLIYAARGQKPIIAYANGQMASAAYWIGSAADLVMANETAQVGSVGVAAMHYDYSAADAKQGLKRTAIYAGKYKRIASDEKPLSDEGAAYLQSQVDTLLNIFAEGVARNRGVDLETGLNIADGKIYIGKQAQTAGLVDKMGNFNDALALARAKGGAMPKNMTKATLLAENPELFQAILAEGAAGVTLESLLDKQPAAAETLRAEGEQRERTRVVEILEADGDQTVALEAIKSGATAGETFKLFFKAEKDGREKALEDMKKQAPGSLGRQPESTAGGGENFESKVQQLVDGQKMARAKAVIQTARDFPDLHADYIARQNQPKK